MLSHYYNSHREKHISVYFCIWFGNLTKRSSPSDCICFFILLSFLDHNFEKIIVFPSNFGFWYLKTYNNWRNKLRPIKKFNQLKLVLPKVRMISYNGYSLFVGVLVLMMLQTCKWNLENCFIKVIKNECSTLIFDTFNMINLWGNCSVPDQMLGL